MKHASKSFALSALVALITFGGAGITNAGPLPAGYTCVGSSVCGTLGADGVVTASPQGGDYGYVTTAGSGYGNGNLGIGSETNSSVARSPVFASAAGDLLRFHFNYVTSDGAGFIEYAWVKLIDAVSSAQLILFTARTTPSGNTVPGFGLPGLAPGVVLNPGSTAIIGGAPSWSPLGGSSGSCWDAGCGYTGWIDMDYNVVNASNYYLEFGVTNWSDESFQSGLAFDGITIAGTSIDQVPEPGSLALLGLGLFGLAAARKRKAA